MSGCLVNSDPKEFQNLKENVLFASNLDNLFILLQKEFNLKPKSLQNKGLKEFTGQTRAFHKVQ
ncbi:MAG: hypothetical protein ABFD79_16440, partial [Phycisphaerales bacterium]